MLLLEKLPALSLYTTRNQQAASIATPESHRIADPSYTVLDFRLAEGITRPTYDKLQKQERGPREMRMGRLVRISHGARMKWQRDHENPKDEEATAVRKEADRLRDPARRADRGGTEANA